MKIVHICLSGYIDGWGYQENLLPTYQARAGHNVSVISSSNHYPSFLKKEELKSIQAKGNVYEYDRVTICRIKTYVHIGSLVLFSPGLCRMLRKMRPDIIFHHDIAIPSLFKTVCYKWGHRKMKIVVDNHADEINQTKKRWWYLLYYRIFIRLGLKLISPFITKYYGVTPGRCDYLNKVFGVAQTQIELLPIGGDVDIVQSIQSDVNSLKKKYGIPIDGKVIVSGGKMGLDKGTNNLIEAFKNLKEEFPALSLVLFGQFTDEVTQIMAETTNGIYTFGWCNRQTTMEILKLSNVACWPIHHTTLVEDALACAVPLILRKTGNTSHSIERNGEFVMSGTVIELQKSINAILFEGHYDDYKDNAIAMQNKHSYRKIAQKVVIDCCMAE